MVKQPATTTYALLMNARSRRGNKKFKYAADTFRDAPKAELMLAKAVRTSGQFDKALDEIIARKPDVLVVGGGDGTVCKVAGRLVRTSLTCALLPTGTTNNFARSIGLPLDFEDALNTALYGAPKKFDIAQIGDDYFANVASLGLTTKIALHASDRLKKLLGRVAYGLAGLRELLTHRAMYCEIEANGRTYSFTTHQLIIANGRYHSAVKISDTDKVDDGKMIVFSMDDGKRWRLLQNFVRFNADGIKNLSGNEVIRASRLTLTTRPRRRIELDGELGPRTPLTITCLPRAVTFRVPEEG